METYINTTMFYTQTKSIRKMLRSEHRQPAIVRKSRSQNVLMQGTMFAVIAKCMEKYKHLMRDVEYMFWMEFFVEIITDEIDGYIRHQYSRIPSSSPNSFATFVEMEFNELIAPLCKRAVRRPWVKERRRFIIDECNKELEETISPCEPTSPPKVKINEDKNTLHEYEVEDDYFQYDLDCDDE